MYQKIYILFFKSSLDRFVSNANKENVRKGVINSIQLGYWDGGMFYDVPEDLQQRAINKMRITTMWSNRRVGKNN